jgi:hypothetical protein
MSSIQRMPIIIPGLDEMREGGLPRLPYPAEIAQTADAIVPLSNFEANLVCLRSVDILRVAGTSHSLGKHAVDHPVDRPADHQIDISAKGLTVYQGLHL